MMNVEFLGVGARSKFGDVDGIFSCGDGSSGVKKIEDGKQHVN